MNETGCSFLRRCVFKIDNLIVQGHKIIKTKTLRFMSFWVILSSIHTSQSNT